MDLITLSQSAAYVRRLALESLNSSVLVAFMSPILHSINMKMRVFFLFTNLKP